MKGAHDIPLRKGMVYLYANVRARILPDEDETL